MEEGAIRTVYAQIAHRIVDWNVAVNDALCERSCTAKVVDFLCGLIDFDHRIKRTIFIDQVPFAVVCVQLIVCVQIIVGAYSGLQILFLGIVARVGYARSVSKRCDRVAAARAEGGFVIVFRDFVNAAPSAAALASGWVAVICTQNAHGGDRTVGVHRAGFCNKEIAGGRAHPH